MPSLFPWKLKDAIVPKFETRRMKIADESLPAEYDAAFSPGINASSQNTKCEDASPANNEDCYQIVTVSTTKDSYEIVKVPKYREGGNNSDIENSVIQGPKVVCDHITSRVLRESNGQQERKGLYSAKMFQDDDEGIQFYTGLDTFEKFMSVLNSISPEIRNLDYGCSSLYIATEDALLLTLMKLWRNTSDYELARFFGISKLTVVHIFVAWVDFLDNEWSKLDTWPCREIVDFCMPEASEESVGAPSDFQVMGESDLGQKCVKKSDIIVSRGQNSFSSQSMSVTATNSYKGKGQLNANLPQADKKLPLRGRRVNNVIELIKTYKILSTPLISDFVPIASKIFSVCFMLWNFWNVS